jgi:hypothetical protein
LARSPSRARRFSVAETLYTSAIFLSINGWAPPVEREREHGEWNNWMKFHRSFCIKWSSSQSWGGAKPGSLCRPWWKSKIYHFSAKNGGCIKTSSNSKIKSRCPSTPI